MNYQNKAIVGGAIGNIVEAYDLSICYFLSTELSRTLLGDSQGTPTVILTLMFIAYLAKPIGAFFLGLFSDLYGRKNILTYSIMIMGLSTALIGVIPQYSTIGLSAVLCLLTLRIVQSMALGSEFLNSSSLLVESGTPQQRGYRGCWSSVGVKLGYILACLVVIIVHYYAELHPEYTNLWRIPFFFALLTTSVGYYIREKMPESLEYIRYYAQHPKPATRDIYRTSLTLVKQYPFLFYFSFFTSFLSVTTGFFFYLYIPMHAIHYAAMSSQFVMCSNILSLLFATLLIPVFGKISDRTDRLTLLIYASAGLLLMAYPFMVSIHCKERSLFLIMQLLISIPCACYYSVATVLITELFPLQVRCTTLSIVYSIAASLASGLPPLLADYLTRTTQILSAPSLIIIILAAIVLCNSLMLKARRTSNMSLDVPLSIPGIRTSKEII